MECLCAELESPNVEPGWTCPSGNACARLTEGITELSHNTFSGILPSVEIGRSFQLTKRQKKRISEKKRKHKLYSKSFKMTAKVSEQKDLLANAEKQITSLQVFNSLYRG